MMTRALGILLSIFLNMAVSLIANGQDEVVARKPVVERLEQIVDLQLSEDLPSISAIAFNGEDIYGFAYYGRHGYMTLETEAKRWRPGDVKSRGVAIGQAAGRGGQTGGACFVKDQLWIAGAYGHSIACIDTKEWKVIRTFEGKQVDHPKGQSYSGITHDGEHLWVVWHSFRSDLPQSKTQRLLKMVPETGEVVANYPLAAGRVADGSHGLTWDGARVWHIKDKTLSMIDPKNGQVTAHYKLGPIDRPSGLTWIGDALLISEFGGRVWRLPLSKARNRKSEM